jgi:excisionase family DNA binding protein
VALKTNPGGYQVLFSTNDTCKQLRIGRTLVYQLIKRGELEVVKIAGRTLVTKESAKRLIEANKCALAG